MIERLSPYAIVGAVALAVGFAVAWYIQGLRITAAEQALATYQQGMREAVVAAREHEQQRQQETVDAWSQNLAAYRRSVAAGWVPVVPRETGAGLALPATPPAYGGGPDAVSIARAAEAQCRADFRRVVTDCAETTLQLNALQDDIARQGSASSSE